MVDTGAALPVPDFNHPGYPGADFHDFFSHLCGREIWCQETAKITHHGNLAYSGDYVLAA